MTLDRFCPVQIQASTRLPILLHLSQSDSRSTTPGNPPQLFCGWWPDFKIPIHHNHLDTFQTSAAVIRYPC